MLALLLLLVRDMAESVASRTTVARAPRLGVRTSEFTTFTFDPEVPDHVKAVAAGSLGEGAGNAFLLTASNAAKSALQRFGPDLKARRKHVLSKLREALPANCHVETGSESPSGRLSAQVVLPVEEESTACRVRLRTAVALRARAALEEASKEACILTPTLSFKTVSGSTCDEEAGSAQAQA